MNRLLPLTCVGALLAALSCTPPTRDYDVEQIRATTELEELMWVQATIADPMFELASELSPGDLGETQRGAFLDMAVRLQASAEVLATLSGLEDFKAYARQMGERAALVEQSVDMQDDAAVLEGTLAIKASCAACHDDFR